jgi:two-component system nitrate/nitrite response regulator NarL
MKVLLCDDHRLFSDALASVLTSRGYTIVGCTVDPAQAVAAVAQAKVDTCLMDLTFPEGDVGVDGVRMVSEASSETRVVVLTASRDPALILRAMHSGAHAIAFKDDDIDRIIEIIEQGNLTEPAPAGVRFGPVSDTSRVESEPTGRQTVRRDNPGRFLTPREHELLEHMLRGASGRRLALEMGISYATVRTYTQNILAKLGVHSRLEALAFAVEHGICELEPTPQSHLREIAD